MKIDLNDPRVNEAVASVKQKHDIKDFFELEKVFEEHYHCKIIYEDPPAYCKGYLDIADEKYQTWFVLQFGVGDE
jgi:hypothetical protein